MFAIPSGIDPRLRMNPNLAEYARLEYRHEDAAWLLAAARSAARTRLRPARSWRPRFLRARTAPRPVACKGTPHRASPEAYGPA